MAVRLISMEREGCENEALNCDMLVSRVFASAQFRRHGASHERFARLVRKAEERGTVLVNPARAHAFEVSKRASAEALAAAALPTPQAFACETAGALLEALGAGVGVDAAGDAGAGAAAAVGVDAAAAAVGVNAAAGAAQTLAAPFRFPCIIKPDCGGRTTYTALVHSA